MIEKISVQLSILQGTGLVAKDRNLFGKKTTSDPYVEIWALGLEKVGRTVTKPKTLSPVWNQTFPIEFRDTQQAYVILKIYDEDMLSDPDSMGVINVPIPTPIHGDGTNVDSTKWYDVPANSAKNASGKIQVRIQTTIHVSHTITRGIAMELMTNCIKVGLAWDMLPGNQAVDLDVSCAAITHQGQLSIPDTVYYGNTSNSNESILHSGDEREGDEVGDDETMIIHLDHVPTTIVALYIILTVATPGKRIPDIQSTTLRVYDMTKDDLTLCTFTPAQHALSQNSTAMFMVRIARSKVQSKHWILSPIETTHPTARDFGSLVPHLKGLTKDLLPNIKIDPSERVAILRKGGNIHLSDYCSGQTLPRVVRFGLAWDVTNGVNIDLDASAICLDRNLQLLDLVWFQQLSSKDGSIKHQGDEREGDEVGDDEKLDIYLKNVSPHIQYIGFVINSFSGQELDDVDRAACHLFDPSTNVEMASYAMTNSQALDGYTALVLACLYRGHDPGEWDLCIIAEPAMGKTVHDNVDELQNYLRRHPPSVSSPPMTPMASASTLTTAFQMPEPIPLVTNTVPAVDPNAPPKKFIKINGVNKLNPEYKIWKQNHQ